MARCSISLLGNMKFTLDGSPLHGLESAKVRALLAYLAVESAQAHEREHLAGLFWPEMPESQARHSLSQSIHNLRAALGETSQPDHPAPVILVAPHTVQFNPQGHAWLDVRAFEQLIAAVRQHAHRRVETCAPCARLLHQAQQLYQGDFMSGAWLHGCRDFEEWVLVWRERLHRMQSETLANLTSYYASHNELRAALELTGRWALIDPFNEPAQRTSMRLLALSGQRTQALERYTGFRRLLLTELGVEPSLETQQLYQRILAEESAQASLPGIPGRLPVPLTPFVGREDELIELAAWLRDPQVRLVTLLGPGGCGKTHLALHVARSLRYDFPDGIFFVSLSGLSSREAFYPALANALGLAVQPGWGSLDDQLTAFLTRRRLLLILDSFEEALAAAPALTQLLQAAHGLHLLVTSRARLNLLSEQVFSLPGLDYPDPTRPDLSAVALKDCSALQLFSNAGRRVRADFDPSPADLLHMLRICQLVDGMPLGIVLAAGWLETCTPAEIAEEIERSLDFLSSSWSDLPERQRSLRATLDHSWRLLDADERQAFQKLSVFQGAFTRQAAEQVAGVSSAGLRSLADKSLLYAPPTGYIMHDMLRQYGAEKLAAGESAFRQVRHAHSTYFLERLAGQESRLKSAQRSAALNEIDAETNNLQAAWSWACAQADIPLLARSLHSLCLYFEMRMRYLEGEQACQAALSMPPVGAEQASQAAVLRSRLLLWRANFLVLSGELEAASALRQQAGELLDRLEAQGLDVRRPRAMYWQAEGDAQLTLKPKLECYQRAIALYQDLGDAWRQAGMLVWAGEYAMRLGDPNLALSSQQEALRLARQVGEPDILLHAFRQTTYLYFILNRYELARQLMDETIAYLETVPELPLRTTAQMHLGGQMVWIGQFAEAASALERTVPLLRSLGYRYGVAFGSMGLGIARCMSGEYSRAEAFLQAAIPETEQGGFPREAAIMLLMLGLAVLAQGRPAQALEYLEESVRRYRQMQFTGELGWALGGLVLAQHAMGQPEPARVALLEALRIAEKTHSMFAINTSLPALVYFLARQGHLQTALLAHRVALRQPLQHDSPWYRDLIGRELDAGWSALPPDQQASLDASALPLDPFTLIPHVLPLLASPS